MWVVHVNTLRKQMSNVICFKRSTLIITSLFPTTALFSLHCTHTSPGNHFQPWAIEVPTLWFSGTLAAAWPTLMLWLRFTSLDDLRISWKDPNMGRFGRNLASETVEAGENVLWWLQSTQILYYPRNGPLEKWRYFCMPAWKSLLEECLWQSCISALRAFWRMHLGGSQPFLPEKAKAIRQSTSKPLITFARQRVRAASPHNNVETEILQSKGL